MRVTAFTKYDREAASTRQRFLQYISPLAEAGIELTCRPLIDDLYVRSLATGERWSRIRLLRSYGERIMELLRRSDSDILWIHGELFPYLPLVFDRLVFRSGRPIVYDCDDAFFVPYEEHSSGIVRKLLSGKVESLIAGATAATCGNEYLRNYASRFCKQSFLFPTVVDTEVYQPTPCRKEGPMTIGWIGSPSTWKNVRSILPILGDVCAQQGARFRVVGAGNAAQSDVFEGMELLPWSEESEVAAVQAFDIGISPLADGSFQRGKSGYKLVQYMACAVPAIASPVGANNGVMNTDCGIFATTAQEWRSALIRLLDDAALRRKLGSAGRDRAVEHYSLHVHAPRLIRLFRQLHERSGADSRRRDRPATEANSSVSSG
jgi:glycosyltransferase involved in cell wall biosynthesis